MALLVPKQDSVLILIANFTQALMAVQGLTADITEALSNSCSNACTMLMHVQIRHYLQ